jgi:rhodanese-related sulfurtransferase
MMMIKNILSFILAGVFLTSCAFTPLHSGESAGDPSANYQMISVTDLQSLKADQEFTLINVHIPLDENIAGTDLEIPYNEIEKYAGLLPDDKDEKIIIYCRSGSMGNIASKTLVEMGYTDVSNLEGGYAAWQAAGLPLEEKR